MASIRSYCERCFYPQKTCICSAISEISTKMQISVLQDPSETKQAKNTARLLPLILPRAKMYVGEMPQDFHHVQDAISAHKHNLVLYPNPNAITMGSEDEDNRVDCDHLIVLDGTWRKAKKLWLNNTWLHELKSITLLPEGESEYVIRATQVENSMSTLEAVSVVLNKIEQVPRDPFSRALNALQFHWQRHAK